MKTKTTTIRLTQELLKAIDESCEKNSTCRNDFIKNAITNQLELEAGVEEKKTPSVSQKENIVQDEPTEISKSKVIKISYDDGKTWYDDKGNLIKDTDTKSKEPYYDKHGNYYYYNHEKGTWVCRIIL